MSEVKVNIEKVDGNELIIRTGGIVEKIKPLPVKFSGVLSAPGDFLTNRKAALKVDNCRLEIDFNKAHLTFYSDERSNERDVIEGNLTKAKIIETFGINAEVSYTDKALAKFLRQHAFYFPDQTSLQKLIDSLMKFEAKVTAVFENKQDLKGNAKVLYERTVEQSIPEEINVKLAVFEGYPEEIIKLSIGAEATSSGVEFFFESPELCVLEEKLKRSILAEEIKKFSDFGCAILNK
jgi:hypothetical protein